MSRGLSGSVDPQRLTGASLAMGFTTRPTVQGYGGAVSAGHYLATQVGAEILTEGGNAADAAVHSLRAPSSFFPRLARPGASCVEGRIRSEVQEGLRDKGHQLTVNEPWYHGRVLAAANHSESGLCEAAASPRLGVAYAIALA